MYQLTARLHSWSFENDCATGRDILTRELVTTHVAYRFDPLTHMLYCLDGKAYLLDYTGCDLQATVRLAKLSPDLPLALCALQVKSMQMPFVTSQRSVELMATMPGEVLLHIFRYVDTSCRANVLRTCWQFNKIGEARFITPADAVRRLTNHTNYYIDATSMFWRRISDCPNLCVQVMRSEMIHPVKPIHVYSELWRHVMPGRNLLRSFTYRYPHEYSIAALRTILSQFTGKYSVYIPYIFKEIMSHGCSDATLTAVVDDEMRRVLKREETAYVDLIVFAMVYDQSRFFSSMRVCKEDITQAVLDGLVNRKSTIGMARLVDTGFIDNVHIPRVFKWVVKNSWDAGVIRKFLALPVIISEEVWVRVGLKRIQAISDLGRTCSRKNNR